MVNCLFRQAGQIRNDEITYARNIIATYYIFANVTNPATETKSIGLPGQISG